jgi:hypothetical protein
MKLLIAGLGLCAIAAPFAAAQNAADAYYDPQAMAAARAALKEHHGNQVNSLLIAERLEYLAADDEDALVWEAQGWVGTDMDKLWVKTEGEHVDGEGTEEAELQLLYSRAVSPFWDLQAGARQDLQPSPNRSHLVIGAQGLAPYWFEVDTALFLSDEGKLSARLEAEYELRLTQRLILQPRIELNFDFIARLAALVPKPRVNLTRYHGVLAPNHRWRGLVTPARRGKGIKSTSNAEVRTPAERHTAMTWAQRLKRVFNIDMPQGTLSWRFAPIHLVEVCSLCGGSVRVIACIEDQDVIDRILTHLRHKERETLTRPLLTPPTRAPPGTR